MSTDNNDPSFVRLANGSLIDTATGKRSVSTEINKAFSDQPYTSMLSTHPAYGGSTRRYIDDLPVDANKSRAVAVVVAYTLFGLAPADIAYILNINMEVVSGIIAGDAYNQILEGILQNVREHDKDVVRRKLNAAAEDAADKITRLVESDDEGIAFKAASNVLDRVAGDGLSANKLGSSNSVGLTIRIIDDKDNPVDKVKVEIDA